MGGCLRASKDNHEAASRPHCHHLATPALVILVACAWVGSGRAMPALVPQPQEVRLEDGVLNARRPWLLDAGELPPDLIGIRELNHDLRAVFHQQLTTSAGNGRAASAVRLILRLDRSARTRHPWQSNEAYHLSIGPDTILIAASTQHGCFNGVQTLRQLVRGSQRGQIGRLSIADYPALRWRGVSDDISRGQASTLADFRSILEHLAYFKLNLYCIYIEDMARLWSAPEVGANRQALTPSEFKVIAAEADRYHITLVPIFETLGHQERMLALPSLSALSDSPPPSDLAVAIGRVCWAHLPIVASSLGLPDPANPQPTSDCFSPISPTTRARVATMADEIAASIPSPFFHLGGDEPSALGKGRSRRAIESRGLGAVYADYLNALGRHVLDAMSRQPLVFSDVLLANSDAMTRLDRRVGVVDWHYDTVSRGESIERLRTAGFETIFASPGLWNWSSIYPNFASAFQNIALQADAAREFDATGLILASWGDGGAECLRQSNWPGYAYAADAAWRRADSTSAFLSRFTASEFGSGDPRLAAVITIVGWQRFPSLGFNQRAVYRPARIAPRTPAWRTRMTLLAADMLQARAALSEVKSLARFRVDELEVIDYAAARFLLTAVRESTLDELGRALEVTEWGALSVVDRLRYTQALQAAADSSAFLDRKFGSLWVRHNRKKDLQAVLARQSRLTKELGDVARSAQDGSLRSTRVGTPSRVGRASE
jgi:hypothetical protein